MTRITLIAAALIATAGAASASLFGGLPVDVDPATLSDTQRLLIEQTVHGDGSAAEKLAVIRSLLMQG